MKLHYITLHYIALHYITLRYSTLHTCKTLHTCIHYIHAAMHYIHYIAFSTLHSITLHCLHYITVHCITLQYITLHYITYMTWHDMTRHDMTYLYVNAYICIRDFTYVYKWRIELPTRKGHGQSGCSPIGCEGSHTDLNIPSPLPASLVLH